MVQDMLENESRKCTEKTLLHFGTSKIKPPIPPLQTYTVLHFHTLRCAMQSFKVLWKLIAGVNLKRIRSNQAENSEQPHREGSGGTRHNFNTWFVASEYGPDLGMKVRPTCSLQCSKQRRALPVPMLLAKHSNMHRKQIWWIQIWIQNIVILWQPPGNSQDFNFG